MARTLRTTEQEVDTPHRSHLLQAPELDALGSITRLAAQVFGLPFAAISLTDATCQWLRAVHGQLPAMTPRTFSPCFHVADTAECLTIEDLATHPEYQSGLLAGIGMRFYAGAPLIDPDGTAVGALCIMGPEPQSMIPAQLALLRDLAVLAMDAAALHRAARVDPLTGLPNRRHLLEELASLPPGQPRQFALLDLAHPDELAHMLHTVGSARLDEKVRLDAHGLHAFLNGYARMFHIAPTQFAFVAPPDTDPAELGSRLHTELARARLNRHALFSTTCTVGLATYMPREAEPAEMLRQANTALDEARAKGLPFGVYGPGQDNIFRRAFTLLNDFSTALTPTAPNTAQNQGHGLRLAYQPRIELATGQCIGVEALFRWSHPILGEIAPGEFINLVEKTNLARGLMHWVLATALAQLAEWRATGIWIQLSVNVFPTNLEDDDFAAHVLAALAAVHLPPTALELEITESTLLNEAGPSLGQLRTLSEAGVCIAIDDFGTGYSSLSYLQRLPADVVKIDQSFIRGLSQGGDDEARLSTLVAAMIGLSHDLGYRVVAEGVETQSAADLLLQLNCDEVQGYWFARPMHPSALTSWLAQRPWAPPPQWQTAPCPPDRVISA